MYYKYVNIKFGNKFLIGSRKKTIEELKEFVTYCNEFRSTGKAFDFFNKFKSVDNMIKQLDNIQTN